MRKCKWTAIAALAVTLSLLLGCGAGAPITPGTLPPIAQTPPPVQPTPSPAQPVAPPKPAGPTDEELAQLAQENAARQELLQQADLLARSYDYDGAIALLQSDAALQNDDTAASVGAYRAAQAALVRYEGPVRHVFFHSLIADTSKAFDGGYSSAGYDLWMTTVSEFQAMLPQLLERGYVLFTYDDLVTQAEDGTVSAKEIWLPPGKMPLVLSVDDVCYYEYMKGDGFATRLDLDADGHVVTIMTGDDGKESETRDGDVVPILDDFVAQHPEFSYKGAKGILALTGYQGVLGYRITDLTGDALTAAQTRAKAVCDRLKATGWRIASHSYTHNNYFQDGSVTMDQLQYDTGRWKRDIAPVTGETNLYISPFGVHFDKNDPRYRYLVEQGYSIYCPVGVDMAQGFHGDNMTHNRLNLDGFTMRARPQLLGELFFDVQSVYDATRPTPLPG